METTTLAPLPPAIISPAVGDVQFIRMWLNGKSGHTQTAYAHDAARLLAYTAKPLAGTTLYDLQAFADQLTGRPASRYRTLSSVKSMFKFAMETGYLAFNPAKMLHLGRVPDELAQRILPQADIYAMLAHGGSQRNHVLLNTLYATGARVSELCGLCWRDTAAVGDAGQVTLLGKREKVRSVLLSARSWGLLTKLRGTAGGDEPVFRSRKPAADGSYHLSANMMLEIVRAAAARAGIDANVSPHWFRHAHASHALDSGAPIHLVQATLGHASVVTTGRYLHARPSDSSGRFLGI